MNVALVREILDAVLENEGFVRIGGSKKYPRWGRPQTEIVPYFAPAVIRKSFGVQILGVAGMYVTEFEAAWEKQWKKHYSRKTLGNSPLFGRWISNFKEFIDSPVISDERDVKEVVQILLDLFDDFPESINGLTFGLARGFVGPYPAWTFLGHWVKWLAFLQWLKENSYQCPRVLYQLHKNRRISPYEAIFQELNG